MSTKESNSEESTLEHIHKVIGRTLASGMYLTIFMYAIGMVLSFLKDRQVPALDHQYFSSVGGFFAGLVHLDPRPFLLLGTVSLIFTPPACIFLSVFSFWRRHDLKYVGVTTTVLLVIAISVLIGSLFKVKVG